MCKIKKKQNCILNFNEVFLFMSMNSNCNLYFYIRHAKMKFLGSSHKVANMLRFKKYLLCKLFQKFITNIVCLPFPLIPDFNY